MAQDYRQLNPTQQRRFSKFYRSLTDNPIETLQEYQRKYESDTANVEYAFYYFRVSNLLGFIRNVGTKQEWEVLDGDQTLQQV